MRNATTFRMFAVLIGFVLALPAAAEEQNSSTLKTEPVSTDKAASSCSSAASTLVGSSSPTFGGISAGLFTPRDTDPLASLPATAVANEPKACVAGDSACLGKRVNDRCAKDSLCVGYLSPTGEYSGVCKCEYFGPRDPSDHCPPGRQRYCY